MCWSKSTPVSPGGRSTDRADLPEHKVGYALRDLTTLIATCAAYGPNVGIYAERILDDPLPWTRMRTVYRLQGLVRRYGAQRVEQACSVALDLDVVSVNKIASMLESAPRRTRSRYCCWPSAKPLPGSRVIHLNSAPPQHH